MTQSVEKHCKQWVDRMVVGLNLCPFARQSIDNNAVRYAIVDENSTNLTDRFIAELNLLDTDPSIDTTLIVISDGLDDFMDYLDILDGANQILDELGYSGKYQIASFHPEYQFAGTEKDEVGNYTNRAPYPILHLLREASVEKALDFYGREEAQNIPDQNIERLKALGIEAIHQLLGQS